MTKSERLLYILGLLKVRKKITIEQLSEKCDVSRRTVYRDMVSLSNMNIPIYCDHGYGLARDISIPTLNFTKYELEILGFSLETSLLQSSKRMRDVSYLIH